jgi:ferric-dicitrate binding protein FerR (iron transport regulator)
MNDDDLDDLAARVMHAGLDPVARQRLTDFLAADPAHAARWLDAVRHARDLAMACRARTGRERPDLRHDPRRRVVMIGAVIAAGAIAALVLIVIGVGRQAHDRSAAAPLARLDGRAIADGDTLAIAASQAAVLHWHDGSRLILDGPATAICRAAEPRLELTSGRLAAEITPQGPDGCRIAIPDGELAVLGTAFTIDLGTDAFRIAVSHGRVALRHPAIGERLLAAGDAADLAIGPWRRDPSGDPVFVGPGARMGDGGPSVRMRYRRPDATPRLGYANLTAPCTVTEGQAGVLVPVRLVTAAPATQVNLMAVEDDGDVWYLGHVACDRLPPHAWVTIGFTLRQPIKIQYRGGDGVWDRLRTVRLLWSAWGGDVEADVGGPVLRQDRSAADMPAE